MNVNFKIFKTAALHLPLYLLALTLIVSMTGCSDNDPEEDSSIIREPEAEWVTNLKNNPQEGIAFYDTIENVVVLKMDSTAFPSHVRDMLRHQMIYPFTLHPYRNEQFDVEPGHQYSFRIRELASSWNAIGGLMRAQIFDLCEISETKIRPCGVKDDVISRAFDTNFKNEPVSEKVVKVRFHLVRDITGAGFNEENQYKASMEAGLNQTFRDAKISFSFEKELIYHDWQDPSTSGSLNDDNYINSVAQLANGDESVVHVFLISHAVFDSFGVTSKIYPNCVLITSAADVAVWTHEMGHVFGLMHTHYGTEYKHNKKGETGGIAEYADGSNSDTAGDYMADTPADPNIWTDGRYSGTVRDDHGQAYNPDPTNFMSYSGSPRSRFTPLQIKKMHKTIRTELPNVLIKADISGIDHFYKACIFSHDLTISRQLVWELSRHMTDHQNELSEIVKTETSTATRLSVSCDNPQYLEVKLKDSETGYIYGSHKATSGAPTPVTGTLYWRTVQDGIYEGATDCFDTGNTLYISENKTLYLEYKDRAGARLSNLGYRNITATHRSLSGDVMTITKADCADGYLKFRLSDACGQSDSYFTINVVVIGGYYAVSYDGNNLLTFKGKSGASSISRPGAPAKIPLIRALEIFSSNGGLAARRDNLSGSDCSIDISSWEKGSYVAVVSDGEGYSQEIPFEI